MSACPECVWCAISPQDHGDCDCPPHDCAVSQPEQTYASVTEMDASAPSGASDDDRE